MAKKSITKTTLAVSLDIDIAEKIKQAAKQEERSVSQMVQRALVHYLPTIQCQAGVNDQLGPPPAVTAVNSMAATISHEQ